MRLPRFRIRTMMVIVVIAALVGWGVQMVQRSAHASKLARKHRESEALYTQGERRKKADVERWESSVADEQQRIAKAEKNAAREDANEEYKKNSARLASEIRKTMDLSIDELQDQRKELARYSEMRRYYSSLASKYELAARYPWLPVAPDPPVPD